MENNESHNAALKVFLSWIGVFYGSLTLSNLVLVATLIYTLAQIYFSIRDRWWRDPARMQARAHRRMKQQLEQPAPTDRTPL